MLRRDPRPGPSRIRLRRRLLLFSAPAVVVALLAACKMIAVVIAGGAAVSDFARHDRDAMRNDMSTVAFLNIIEPDKVRFGQGDLAALQGNLGEADSRFTEVLSHTDGPRSCAVRVNLELVRETQGDRAVADRRPDAAEQHYTAALKVVRDAPRGCFEGNSDPNGERRAVRNDAAARLMAKINALRTPQSITPPQPPAPPPAAQPPAPPPGGTSGSGADQAHLTDIDPDRLPGSGPTPSLQLQPGTGNPLDRLQEALGNSDAAAPNHQ